MLLAAFLFVTVTLTATGVSLARGVAGSHEGPATETLSSANVGNAQKSYLIAAPIGSCPSPSFSPPTNYPVGDNPAAVVSVDLNNDGNLDLATGNNTPGTVSVLLGNGMGAFTSAGDFPAGNAPSDITSADFNEDGNADLALARAASSPDNVSVMLGNGMGGFGPPTLIVAGTFTSRIRVGDFNEDGNVDIVVSNFNSASVSLLLGDGTGGFGSPMQFPAGARPIELEVGDFNEDGNLDLVVSNETNPGTISVLLGNGMGGFGPPASYPSGQDTGELEIGDFNEDGNIDVAARSGYNISVLLGNGSGGFGSPTEYPAGGLSSSIVARDFTLDGHLDLASGNLIPSSNVSVLMGNGTGGFAPPVTFLAGNFPGDLAPGDFNEDGSLDLAASNHQSDDVSVLLNNCQPVTTATPTTVSTATPTQSATPSRTATFAVTPTSTAMASPTSTSASTATPTAESTATPTTSTATPTVIASATTTATPPPTPAACTITFTDVPSEHTFYASVRCLACRGIISGYSDGTFRPDNLVTRSQLAKIVSNAGGFTENPGGQIFEDVPPGHPFYEWINRLTNRGYMSGYSCGSPGEPCIDNRPYFRPFADATRAQTTKIVSNAAMFTEPPTGQTFEDVPPSHPFYEWIQRLASRGIMGGYNCGGPGEPCVPPGNRAYFRPYNNVTRGQSAKIVANTFFSGCETSNHP
jgi:hypothetical protein